MKRCLMLLLALLLCTTAALAEIPVVPSAAVGENTAEGDRDFVFKSRVVRTREVMYYPDVYAINHGKWGLTPFDAALPEEYFTVDAAGYLAVAPRVWDVTDAMRYALYQGDIGQVALLYGQYTELAQSKSNDWGFSGIHEGIDFISSPGTKLHAILGGIVLRTGKDKDGTIAIYNEELDATVLYLHCRNVQVKYGQEVEAGHYIAKEGNKGAGGTYAHVELRLGRHTSPNPYRNTLLESDLPYDFFAEALGVMIDENRQTPTYATELAQETLLAEQKAATEAAAAEAERLAAIEAAKTPEPTTPVVAATTPEPTATPAPTQRPVPTAAPLPTLAPIATAEPVASVTATPQVIQGLDNRGVLPTATPAPAAEK